MATFLTILTFIAGFLVVFGVNLLLADLQAARRLSVRERLDDEWRLQNRERARLELPDLDRDHDIESRSAFNDPNAEYSSAWVQWVADFVQQSGKRIQVSQVVIWSLLSAAVAASAPGLLLHQWLVAAIVAPFAAAIPWLYIWRLRARRLEKLRDQLPDTFDLMSRVLRAGQTISQALQSVADEIPRPAAEEFGYAYEQQNLGLSPEAAMRDLARRTGLLEMKIFVLAVMVHRQTGGNLADLLNKLSGIIRDRFRVRGTIRAMTAEGRLQATILLALPPLLLLAITLINRPYATILYQYPNLVVGMFAFMSVGFFWMRRIINFDF